MFLLLILNKYMLARIKTKKKNGFLFSPSNHLYNRLKNYMKIYIFENLLMVSPLNIPTKKKEWVSVLFKQSPLQSPQNYMKIHIFEILLMVSPPNIPKTISGQCPHFIATKNTGQKWVKFPCFKNLNSY